MSRSNFPSSQFYHPFRKCKYFIEGQFHFRFYMDLPTALKNFSCAIGLHYRMSIHPSHQKPSIRIFVFFGYFFQWGLRVWNLHWTNPNMSGTSFLLVHLGSLWRSSWGLLFSKAPIDSISIIYHLRWFGLWRTFKSTRTLRRPPGSPPQVGMRLGLVNLLNRSAEIRFNPFPRFSIFY